MLKHEDGREGYSLREKIDLRTHSSGSHLFLSTPICGVENVYGKLKYSICESNSYVSKTSVNNLYGVCETSNHSGAE